jgi:hypothetical protein
MLTFASMMSKRRQQSRIETHTRVGRAAQAAAARSVVQTDAKGRPTLVRAGSAMEVLMAFCGTDWAHERYEPVEMQAVTPPRAGLRLGILRDVTSPDSRYAIAIMRHQEGTDWIAGNGADPIEPGYAPMTDEDVPSMPVSEFIPQTPTQ